MSQCDRAGSYRISNPVLRLGLEMGLAWELFPFYTGDRKDKGLITKAEQNGRNSSTITRQSHSMSHPLSEPGI